MIEKTHRWIHWNAGILGISCSSWEHKRWNVESVIRYVCILDLLGDFYGNTKICTRLFSNADRLSLWNHWRNFQTIFGSSRGTKKWKPSSSSIRAERASPGLPGISLRGEPVRLFFVRGTEHAWGVFEERWRGGTRFFLRENDSCGRWFWLCADFERACTLRRQYVGGEIWEEIFLRVFSLFKSHRQWKSWSLVRGTKFCRRWVKKRCRLTASCPRHAGKSEWREKGEFTQSSFWRL